MVIFRKKPPLVVEPEVSLRPASMLQKWGLGLGAACPKRTQKSTTGGATMRMSTFTAKSKQTQKKLESKRLEGENKVTASLLQHC